MWVKTRKKVRKRHKKEEEGERQESRDPNQRSGLTNVIILLAKKSTKIFFKYRLLPNSSHKFKDKTRC